VTRRPLSVGIQLPEVERDVRWPEYLAMARACEEVGFDSIWVGDHLLYRDDGGPERGPWEAWTLLAGLAAVTSRVKLGPLVACAGFHPPAVVAKMAATVDEISAGRLVFGVGSGWNPPDFAPFDVPFDHRVSRFEDWWAILRPLLAGERVTHAGEWWSAEDVVLLPKPSRRIPLMVGSDGPRMLSITLPWADSWNTWYDLYGNTVAGFAESNVRIDSACRDVGRQPSEVERSACVFVDLDGSPAGRPYDLNYEPVRGPAEATAGHLRQLADAGADEAILVVNPITEASVRELGAVLSLLDS